MKLSYISNMTKKIFIFMKLLYIPDFFLENNKV